jgi:hypothetical protein
MAALFLEHLAAVRALWKRCWRCRGDLVNCPADVSPYRDRPFTEPDGAWYSLGIRKGTSPRTRSAAFSVSRIGSVEFRIRPGGDVGGSKHAAHRGQNGQSVGCASSASISASRSSIADALATSSNSRRVVAARLSGENRKRRASPSRSGASRKRATKRAVANKLTGPTDAR